MFNKTVIILAFFNLLTLKSNSLPLSAQQSSSVERELNQEHTTAQWQPTAEISPYDALFRTLSEEHGNDWRLLCAMAYHESRFQPDVVSRSGARGILQVMPHVAKQFDVSAEQLINVEQNIYVANRVMSLIDDMLQLPLSTSSDDRLKLTLAAYNCGIGRVADARRLARKFGEDSTSWSVVSQYLTKMKSPEYYQQEVVKYGRFNGAGETLAYVNNVVEHYEDYCLLAMR